MKLASLRRHGRKGWVGGGKGGEEGNKKKKKNARKKRDKSLPCVDVSRFIIIFLPLFFPFYSSFSRSQQKGRSWRGLEVNKFRKKVFASSLSSIYIIYSSRVSIWRSSSGIGSIRHCSTDNVWLENESIFGTLVYLFVCLSVYVCPFAFLILPYLDLSFLLVSLYIYFSLFRTQERFPFHIFNSL